ncbi:MAG: DNA translocase FtsK 4TM domain-containing protein [Phycisphaeraceae bacterium]|nr:DNA translocase FtsK 4TM domain-containing protein [Phycisphaeraceae bacterium]
MITEGSTAVRLSARAARAGAESSPASRRPVKARPAARAKPSEPTEPDAPTPGLRIRQLLWVGGAIAWALVLLSLLSYSAADAPSASIAPHNNPPANWVGTLGALIAHFSYLYFGLGAWVLVALGGVLLGVTATGRRATHLPVRILGALLMAAAVAGLQALALPTSGPVSGLGGGLVGTVGVSRLMPGLNVIGTLVVLLAALWIGALVALDVWALIAAMWTGRFIVAAGRTGGRAAIAAAQAARHRRSAAALAQTRENDIDDDRPDAALPARPRRARRDEAAADEAEMLETMGGGAPAASVGAIDEDSDESDVDTMDDSAPAPGGPKVFDPEQLRAKIAKLPVRFATQTRRSATEDDLRDIQNSSDMEGYRFPGVDLLEEPEGNYSATMEVFVREQAEALERAIKEYGIEGEVVGVESGPVITLFELRLAPGTKVSQLQAIASDVARSLKAVNIRIVSNMAGRDTVGVEVPNAHKEKVRLKELMTKSEFYGSMRLPMFLGKDASGEPLIADLAAMPHLLIAGTTGSGKSVCMNTVIMSFLYTKKPNELKLVLVDPKMVELSQFKDIPHLMCPVVTEMAKAAAILEWAVTKMDERYELLAEAGCRDISSYNDLTWDEVKERLNLQTPEEEARVPRKLPYMVFVIDELADLMMTNKEVEQSIVRIAQKARAVGIHLILATQRPQANVVTGLIKSNMPARISFKVASGMDSRIVLDQKGGELLLGQGDMLYLSPRSSKLTRAQGTLVDDKEIRRVVKFMREVASPTFERQLLQLRPGAGNGPSEDEARDGLQAAQQDPLFDKAVEIVVESKRGSVSMLQRRLAIGYTRSSRLVEAMWQAGIVGDHKGTVDRDVLISQEEWQAMKAQAAADAAAAGEEAVDPDIAEKLRAAQVSVNATGSAAGGIEDEADALESEDDDGEEEDDDDAPFDVQLRQPRDRVS